MLIYLVCSVEIISEAFEHKQRVERHRMVYEALGEELKDGVHALSLKLLSPSEADPEVGRGLTAS
jgi:stress-induced morphogen